MEVNGKYGKAEIYSVKVEHEAISQVITLLNQKAFEGSKIRVMPDVHAGAGCVIGFTGKFTNNRVIPNIVGVDIGCGMFTAKIGKMEIDLEKFDEYVKAVIPMGSKRNNNVGRKKEIKDFMKKYVDILVLEDVCKKIGADFNDVLNSLGTLGGGNHFIEIDKSSKTQEYYLIIHSGSRNFGKRVAEWHQKKAEKSLEKRRKMEKDWFDKEIFMAKQQNDLKRVEEIQSEYEKKKEIINVPRQLSYLEDTDASLYIEDMKVAQRYAAANRDLMCERILKFFEDIDNKIIKAEKFQTIHNYISEKDNIVRKGAISAYKGEKVLIPLNMKDGCIIGIGKGKSDWNFSAPHGAGRLMSRTEAKLKLSMEEFEREMKNIYSTTVERGTLDESPMAYKPMSEILEIVGETIEIEDIIKPVYNVKAVEEESGWNKKK